MSVQDNRSDCWLKKKNIQIQEKFRSMYENQRTEFLSNFNNSGFTVPI